MYLKSIKLAGFKSFVDATTIPIRSQMNAIVGPNGCGKSNVVDAIRWVIGETSAKQLRGQSMSDVIFNGTTSRKPVGKAAVELTFDNTDTRITGEFASYNEISIRREVERDGQSNYFINGTLCRRRDIVDIFLGTGLGPRSYAIIEQGMVSRLIEAKPEDTRVYLEEVAGISKYKERRRETENRMRRTQENLERLNDVRDELAKQLRTLTRQANAAERYKEYKQQERLLHAQTKALQWRDLNIEMEQFQQKLYEKQSFHEEKVTEHRHVETEIEKARVWQTELSDKQHNIQKDYYQLGSEIARLEQQIQNVKEQTQRWQSELQESDRLWEEVTDNYSEYQQQIQEIQAEIVNLDPQSSQIHEAAEESNRTLLDAEANMQQWQQQWDSFQYEFSQTQRSVDVAATKLDHYQQQITHLDQRISSLSKRQDQQFIETLQNELMPLAQEVEVMSNQLQSLKDAMQQMVETISEQRQSNAADEQKIKDLRKTLQAQQTKFASLDAIQQAALGVKDDKANHWLESRGLQQNQRIGKALRVAEGWETAAETILRDYIDAVCVESFENYLPDISSMVEGRLTLVSKSATKKDKLSPEKTTLASLIDCDWPIEEWINGIYAVETIDTALQMQSTLKPNESIITKEGIWLGVNWVRVARTAENDSGVIVREQTLQELAKNIAALQTHIAEQESHLESGNAALIALEEQREVLHQQYQEISAQFSEQQAQYRAKQTRLIELQQQQQHITQERIDCQQQKQQVEQLAAETKQALEQVSSQQSQLSAKKEHLQGLREQLKNRLDTARSNAQRDRQAVDELQIRLSSNQNQLAVLQKSVSHAERQLQQLSQRREVLTNQLSDSDGPIDQFNQALQQQLTERNSIEQHLRTVENELQVQTQQLKSLESQRNQLSQVVATALNDVQELRLQQQSTKVRQSTLKEQVEEEEYQLETLLQELPDNANIEEWHQKVTAIERSIARLGPINLAAIEEHKNISERKTYLDKQEQDLSEALSVLHGAIRKIDHETRDKFKVTFETVNEQFKMLFPKIFGGGRASLELLDDDLLTTGVLVRAQPPGKRNTSIHMLSGGEKALTAIALVFALFELNPAPFCILDEVDAPLDDANVGRFCHLVKEMSSQTQFIVISHNKVTIESADHLMGVTMQEAGVSRIVSVDIAEAIEMATEAA